MTSMKTPLSDAEQDEIGAFLGRIEGATIPSFSALDGLFAAIVCAPDMIMPSEYLPIIQEGATEEDDLVFNDAKEAERFFALIMRHYNAVLSEIRDFGKIKGGEPVFYTPSLLEDDDGELIAEEWAKGFLVGTHLRHEDWDRFTALDQYDDDENSPLLPVMLLAYENHPDPDMQPFDKPVTSDMRQEIVACAVLGIKEIYDEFSEERQACLPGKYRLDGGPGMFVRGTPKVGRNDPCPCGSGKKFKKCCATLKIVR